MKIAVIGGGWYGCHLVSKLLEKNIDIKLFEKNKRIFSSSSFLNTGRLHMGFHYPRSYSTRESCKKNFELFKQHYGFTCQDVGNNYYLISINNSFIDLDTYKQILSSSQISFENISEQTNSMFENIQGGITCKELAINPVIARQYFEKHLGKYINTEVEIEGFINNEKYVEVNGERFDFLINSTYNFFNPIKVKYTYDIIISLIVKRRDKSWNTSFVIMDGDFFSLNKCLYYNLKNPNDYYSIYHVKDSVVFSSSSKAFINENLQYLSNTDLSEWLMNNQLLTKIRTYLPSFDDLFEVCDFSITTRCRMDNKDANRNGIVKKENRVFNIMSGKISSIFEVTDSIISQIK